MTVKEIFQLLKDEKITKEEALRKIEKIRKLSDFQMTKTQENIFNLSQINEYNRAYNTVGAFILKKNVDIENLIKAIKYTVKRFPILGSFFSNTNNSFQFRINEEFISDFTAQVVPVSKKTLEEAIEEEKRQNFSLNKGPVFNIKIFEKESKKVLFCCFHHIIFDSFSADIFLNQIDNYYKKLNAGESVKQIEEAKLDKLTKPKEVENEYIYSEEYEIDKKFWEKALSSYSINNYFGLETNGYENGNFKIKNIRIDNIQKKNIENKLSNGSLSSKILALIIHSMKFLLSSSKDLPVGIPFSIRKKGLWEEMGNFVNMTTELFSLKEINNLDAFTKNIHDGIMRGLDHRFFPYSDVVNFLRTHKHLKDKTPFTFCYNFNKMSELNLSFVEEKLVNITQIGEYNFVFEVSDMDEYIDMKIKYNENVISEKNIKKIKANLINTLFHLNDSNENSKKSNSFIYSFINNAMILKDKTAIIYNGLNYSYGEVLSLAKKLVMKLRNNGVKKGDLVGVMTGRAPEVVISFISLNLMGAVYVPIDEDLPTDRISYMLEKAKIKWIISSEKVTKKNILDREKLILTDDVSKFDEIKIDENLYNNSEELAYVIFTSGSTGNPKGVQISNGSFFNFLSSMCSELQIKEDMHILALTTISFDISLFELILPLFIGGASEILDKRETSDGILLLKKMTQSNANIVQGTPATWRMLIEAGWSTKLEMKALIGGDSFSSSLMEKLTELVDEVWNVYGPTEATIWVTAGRLYKNQKVTLGAPLNNTSILICDEHLNEVEESEIGELFIKGVALSKGYINDEKETSKQFINTKNHGLIYRTGDLAKKIQGGQVEFVGRKDTQIKRRGFRIELSEIEKVLSSDSKVKENCVIYDKDLEDIVAFVKTSQNEEYIRKFLQKKLPYYMVPDTYVYIEEFPLTNNRKVDRKLLLENYKKIPDRDTIEKGTKKNELLDVMNSIKVVTEEDLLNQKTFTEIGFDSILLITLSKKINEKFDCEISPADFYDSPIIKEFVDTFDKKYILEKEFTVNHQLSPQNDTNGVAIIGMSCNFPDSSDIDKFWENLVLNKEMITEVPYDRYNLNNYSSITSSHNKGGFIKDIDKFDEKFFNISPKEATLMDPRQRLLLEMTYHSLEDAGYSSEELKDEKVGVFIGATGNDYLELLLRETNVDSHTLTGNTNAILANRISYLFNFKGPSITVDTACSSSLVSILNGAESIKKGESSIAIVGGISLMVTPFTQVALSQSNMLSKTNKCHSFDQKADGYVRGEGGGLLILKDLKKAIADNDKIAAILKGGAINHCGKTASITAPSSLAQTELINNSLANSHVNADTITNFETHGTGTQLGDPIEVKGIKNAFNKEKQIQNSRCSLGSVKTNIGHLEAAAGIAGTIKMILSLKNKMIPASLNYTELNEHIDMSNSELIIQDKNSKWENIYKDGSKLPLRGAVNSFGFGGTNANLILEEYIPRETGLPNNSVKTYFCPLSAEYENGLDEIVKDLLNFINKNKEVSLNDLVGTLRHGRTSKKYRVLFRINSINELKKGFESFLKKENYNKHVIYEEKDLKDSLEEEKKWIAGKLNGFSKEMYGVYNTLSLPNYPFNRRSHWPNVVIKTPDYSRKRKTMILDKMNVETDKKKFIYDFLLDASEDYIKDHIVEEQIVFPAAGYIEIIMEGASNIISKESSFKIMELTFMKKLTFIEKEVKKCEISFLIINQEKLSFKIIYKEEEIVRGFVAINKSHEKDIKTTKLSENKNSEIITPDEFYSKIENEVNINYGDYYQLLTEIRLTGDQTFSQLILKDDLRRKQENFLTFPPVIDCAIQASVPFIWMDQLQTDIQVPFMIKEFQMLKPIDDGQYFVQVDKQEDNSKNIYIFNSYKDCCAVIYGYISTNAKSKKKLNNYVYGTETVEQVATNQRIDLSNKVVVYHGGDKIFEDLLARHRYEAVKAIELAELNSMKSVLENSKMIYYFSKGNNIESLYALKEFLKSINNLKKQVNVRVVIPFSDSKTSSVREKSFKQFISVVSLENKNIFIEIFNLKYNEENDAYDWYLSEKNSSLITKTNDDGNIIKRKINQFKPITLEDNNGYSGLRKNGVYLVIGFGGIGRQIVRYLVSNYFTKVIIVTFKKLDDKRKKILEEYEKSGGEVTYIQADISDYSEVKKVKEELEKRHYQIIGIFYTAMKLVNKPFSQFSKKELSDSYKVKVDGVENLIQLFEIEKMDFMVLFSSINSYITNINQALYCSVCAAQNELVHYYQNAGLTNIKIINWSYWKDVGAVSSNQRVRKILEQQGVLGIETDEGLEIMDKFLSNDISEIVFFKAEKETHLTSGFLPSSQTTSNKLPVKVVKKLDDLFYELEKYSVSKLWEFFQNNNLFTNINEKFSKESIVKQLNTVPKYYRLLDAFLYILENYSLIVKREGNYWATGKTIESNLQSQFFKEEFKEYISLIDHCVLNYSLVLSGKKSYLEVLYPNNSANLVTNIYRNNQIADYYNQILAEQLVIYLKEALKRKRIVTILEVGAGTGGTTRDCINVLRKYNDQVKYIYTDINDKFLKLGEAEFKHQLKNIKFQKLNIEDHNINFENFGSIDIIIASNVLHATQKMDTTLTNLKKLIDKNGILLINEVTAFKVFSTMTFGLTDGWWYFNDDRIKMHAPTMSLEQWDNLIQRNDFSSMNYKPTAEEFKESSQHIIEVFN